MAVLEPTDGISAVPAADIRLMQERRQGRHAATYRDALSELARTLGLAAGTEQGSAPPPKRTVSWRMRGASLLTQSHQRWIYRRDRSPWLYVLPLGVVAALLVH